MGNFEKIWGKIFSESSTYGKGFSGREKIGF